MSNLSEQQFNKDVFKTLASHIEEGGEGYLQGQLSDSAEYSRYAWSHTYLTMDAPHPWPRHFLKEATSDTNWSGEYREAVHLVLQKSGAVKNGMVTVRRTGKPRPGTINNVSIIPGWKGGGSLRPRATYEWEVPLHDVVGVGKEAEGEIFVHHPPDRAIRKVEDPVRRGE